MFFGNMDRKRAGGQLRRASSPLLHFSLSIGLEFFKYGQDGYHRRRRPSSITSVFLERQPELFTDLARLPDGRLSPLGSEITFSYCAALYAALCFGFTKKDGKTPINSNPPYFWAFCSFSYFCCTCGDPFLTIFAPCALLHTKCFLA